MSFITKFCRPLSLRILSQANRILYGTNCRPIISSSEKPDTFKQVIDHWSKEKEEQKEGSSENKKKDENDKSNRDNATQDASLGLGRFYRQIYALAPDIEGRSEIFRVHLEPIKTNLDIQDLSRKMAAMTSGFTEADIANVCEEATLIAIRDDGKSVTLKDFEEAIERVKRRIMVKMYDMQHPIRVTKAYREAGHAVAGWFLEHADPPPKASIDTELLITIRPPRTKKEFLDRLCMKLARRASEEIFFKRIIGEWEIEIRDIRVFHEEKFVKSAYKRAVDLLTSHKKDVEVVAKGLLARGSLEWEDMIELLGERPFKEKSTY